MYLTTKAEQGVYNYIEYKITLGCWGACVAVGFLAGLLGAVWPVAVFVSFAGLVRPSAIFTPRTQRCGGAYSSRGKNWLGQVSQGVVWGNLGSL